MLRWQKITGLVALLGVLLHAGGLVRHWVMQLPSEEAAVLAATALICHGGAKAPSTADATPAEAPARQPSDKDDCPLCAGESPAPFIPVALSPSVRAPHAPSVTVAIVAERIAQQQAGVRPPPTGPPSGD